MDPEQFANIRYEVFEVSDEMEVFSINNFKRKLFIRKLLGIQLCFRRFPINGFSDK